MRTLAFSPNLFYLYDFSKGFYKRLKSSTGLYINKKHTPFRGYGISGFLSSIVYLGRHTSSPSVSPANWSRFIATNAKGSFPVPT